MKTILFRNQIGEAPVDPLSLQIIPDSAILANRRPFFVPDFDDKWAYSPAVAFRVSRLGKTIGARFASRYFDAMTLAVRTIPLSLAERLRSKALSCGLECAFDGALLIGDWLPLPDPSVNIDGSIGKFTFSFSLHSLHIDAAIHAVSQYLTLKMGDIIIPASIPHTQPLVVNDRLNGMLNGNECLIFKVK